MARKRKYQKGMEMEGPKKIALEVPMDKMPGIPGMYQAPRDSIFTDGKYITTDPRTGLIKEGKDPMDPRKRIEEMAIKNIETDRRNREEEEWHRDYIRMREKEDADRMVDDIIRDDTWDEAEPVDPGMPEPKESDWMDMMKKRKDTIKKSPSPGTPWDDIPYGTKNPKAGPGYRRGGMLKRGGSIKKGAQGRNGVL